MSQPVTPDRWQQVKEALSAALARTSDDRHAYLTSLRARDPDLAREVESLLAHDADATFLEQPAFPIAMLPPGTMFGPYLLQSPLGEGGMGTVYLALDRTLERPVALKFLSRALEQQDDARRRFLREAKAAAALDHPYICKIYQTGEWEGRPFIAMEYIRGETLRDRLDSAALALEDVLRITLEVTEALETAHRAQIVHRDLKPSNIMLTADGHVKVLDFGLAKRLDAEEEYGRTASVLTETGTVRGTVAYMSPEQVRGREVDLRSDLFSLGVVLYESLAGRNPFLAGSALETGSEILHHHPARLTTIGGGVPPALDTIVHRLLAKAPADRYDSASDLRRDLTGVRELVARPGVAALAPDVSTHHPVEKPSRAVALGRRTFLASLAAATGLVGAATWWFKGRPAGSAARDSLSVVVMEFLNISGDADNDYLSSGIARAVTTRLQRAGLRVIPWETARRFDGSTNPVEVARALQVNRVLTGSFQTARGRVLVNVSLVDGATGFLSWSDEFAFDDLFEIQTRIAQGVATTLGHRVAGETAATLARPESSSSDAYDFYLQGAAYLQEGSRESSQIAFDFFRRAVEIDPNLGEAQVGLGAVYLERDWNGWGGGVGNLALAAKSFAAALQRDPKDMRARRGQILIEGFYLGRVDAALQRAEQAARFGGEDVETLLARSEAYAFNGPRGLALPLIERVMALDPGNQTAAWLRPIAFYYSDRLKETVAAAADYTNRFGDDTWIAILAASALELMGDLDSARERFDRAVERVMQPTLEPTSATAYELIALVAAGVFHYTRTSRRDRAQELWRRGLQLTGEALTIDRDSVTLRIFRATFLGFIGDRAVFEMETASVLAVIEAEDLNPFSLMCLAGAYAHLGDTTGAFRLFHRSLDRGRVFGGEAGVTMVAPSLRNTPGMNELLRAYKSEEDRRRRRYSAS